MKAQHQQVEVDGSQTLTEFIKEDEINLPPGEQYDFSDMAVTSDNKLLLCNHCYQKVYIYKDYKTYEISFTSLPFCITVVPCTDKAVVTLPDERFIQFINTTNNTKDNKINIGVVCYSVTAGKDGTSTAAVFGCPSPPDRGLSQSGCQAFTGTRRCSSERPWSRVV